MPGLQGIEKRGCNGGKTCASLTQCVLRQGSAEISLLLCVILILDDGKNWNYESKRDGTCQAGISGATSNVGSTQIFLMGMTGRYLVNGILKIIAKIPLKQVCLNLDFIIFIYSGATAVTFLRSLSLKIVEKILVHIWYAFKISRPA